MAKVSTASICPKCKSVGQMKGGICGSCGTNLWYANTLFKPYINAQMQMTNHVLGGMFKEVEIKEKDRSFEQAQALLEDFYRNSHQSLRISALQEAKLFLQHSMHSQIDGESMKSLITLARSIGELGDAMHKFFTAGGKFGAQTITREEKTTMETR